MKVLLPTGLRTTPSPLVVRVKGDTVVEYTRIGDIVEFVLPGHSNVPALWEIRAE